MSLTAKQSDIRLGKVFIRRSEIFCFGARQQSRSITADSCCVTTAPGCSAVAAVFISETALVSAMLYADVHKNICAVAP